MTDDRLSGVATIESDPRERRVADRRSGGDRRTVDLLRETGRPEHERRRGTDRRSGRDRREYERRREFKPEIALPAEIFMPWQMG